MNVILKCWTGEPGSGWVHIGDELLEPRGQALSYTRSKSYLISFKVLVKAKDRCF